MFITCIINIFKDFKKVYLELKWGIYEKDFS